MMLRTCQISNPAYLIAGNPKMHPCDQGSINACYNLIHMLSLIIVQSNKNILDRTLINIYDWFLHICISIVP